MDWLDLGMTVAELLAPVLMTVLTWASVKAGLWIKAKVQNETYAGMLTRLNETLLTLVRDAEQTAVAAIKVGRAPDSPGGEKLTPQEAHMVKQAVVDKFKKLWGEEGLRLLMKILGLDSGSLDTWLNAKIEAMVVAEKQK